MPWKNKTAETVRRARDNQRRSRARRKELLDDMQQRLEEYERLGVQATLEMQEAARKVARENEQLRALLARKSVSEAEVERFLRLGDSSDDRLARSERGSRGFAGLKEPTVRQIRSQDTRRVMSPINVGSDEEQTTTSCRSEPTSEGSPSNEDLLPGPAETVAIDEDDTATSSLLGSHTITASHPVDVDFSHKSSMETSCDLAAAIIADVQGHGDTSRARAGLGCRGPSACVVKNVRVFDLLDEAG